MDGLKVACADKLQSEGEVIILTPEEARRLEENGMVENEPVRPSLWNKCVGR